MSIYRILKSYIVLAVLFVGTVPFLHAQDNSSDSLEVFFRQGYSNWDPNLKNNEQRVKEFVERFEILRQDPIMERIASIQIISGASPEGPWALNQRLSINRAKCVRNVLAQYIDLPDSVVVVDSRGVNWQGLEAMVAASDMQYRDEVLDIIRNTPELDQSRGYNYELRKKTLERLHGGRPYAYMYRNFFPPLRSFFLKIAVDWKKYEQIKQEVQILPTDITLKVDPMPRPEMPPMPYVLTPPKELPPFYMAIKTNMLYDLAITPNIGVEFYLGNNYAITGNWMYAWWKNHHAHWWHRIYGGDLEVRRYFGALAEEKPLQGWHVGIYGGIVTYDFEWGKRGYLGDRWSYGGGVSLGYSMPFKRRFNIDFTLGIGYLGGEYKEYLPFDDCYVWQATKQRNWIGPTKLEVSLVWLIGRGNYNKGK